MPSSPGVSFQIAQTIAPVPSRGFFEESRLLEMLPLVDQHLPDKIRMIDQIDKIAADLKIDHIAMIGDQLVQKAVEIPSKTEHVAEAKRAAIGAGWIST